MDRPDWQAAIQMPLGVLPGGSGNGLAASLCHAAKEPWSPFNCAFLIARGTAVVSCIPVLQVLQAFCGNCPVRCGVARSHHQHGHGTSCDSFHTDVFLSVGAFTVDDLLFLVSQSWL
jgi:hypothetical protein